MTWTFVAINAVAQATAWLAVIWLAVWLVRKDSPASGGPWRSLLLRIGLAGLPVILLLGSIEHLLPYARPLWRVAPVAEAAKDDTSSPGSTDVQKTGDAATLRGRDAAKIESLAPSRPRGVAASASNPGPTCPTPASALAPLPPPLPSLPVMMGRFLSIFGPPVLGLAWFIGAAFCLARLSVALVRLQLRRRQWASVQNEAIRDLAARVAGRVGLRRPFRLLACDDLATPVATGIFRPAVVLPRKQFGYLLTAQGRAVLAHELAHLRGRDPIWQLAMAVLRCLLWFHPLIAWLAERMEIEAEFRCDQSALAAGADRRRYARLLVHLAERVWSNQPLAPAGAATVAAVRRSSHLERRLTRILARPTDRPTMGRSSRWALLGLSCLLVLSISSVALLGEQRASADEPADLAGPAIIVTPLALSAPMPVHGPTTLPADKIAPANPVAAAGAAPAQPIAPPVAAPVAGPQGQPGQPVQPAQPKLADSNNADSQRSHLRKLTAEADEFLKAGQLDMAAAKLEEVRKLAPGAALQMRTLARIYRQLGQADKADAIEKTLPPPELPRLTAAQADEALALVNRLAAAEEHYAEFRNLDPDDTTHQAQRTAMLAQAGRDVQSAREAINQWKRKNNRTGDGQSLVRDLARRAEDLLNSGKVDLAMPLLADLREVAPRNLLVLRALVRAYDRTGQRDQADEVRRMLTELANTRLTDSRADANPAPVAPAPPPKNSASRT